MSLTRISSLLRLLRKHSSPFIVPGASVKVLYSPEQFFNTLKDGIVRAQKRIILSSLYLGTQKREQELVSLLGQSLSASSSLQCSLLLDYLRGSRGDSNSRTILQPLVSSPYEQFTLGLYHTPNLRGALKCVGPERFNEVMGLQHMKIYIFDNDLVLSGANLSRDYFVDRQDRYVWFRNCPELVNYFAELVNITSLHSFTLNSDGSANSPAAAPINPLASRSAAESFKQSLAKSILELINKQKSSNQENVSRIEQTIQESEARTDHFESKCSRAGHTESESSEGELDTLVFPLIQMGSYCIRQDEHFTVDLFNSLSDGDVLSMASGYFNLPPTYVNAILNGAGQHNILAASPQANGFYGGKGVAGHVPVMYMHFAEKFLEKVSAMKADDRVSYLEYYRDGWTFHGKGLWYYPDGEELPTMSVIGSSNYGYRSLSRDLEAQVAMVTTNQQLRQSLHTEKSLMFDHGQRLTLSEIAKSSSRRLTFLEWIATLALQPHV